SRSIAMSSASRLRRSVARARGPMTRKHRGKFSLSHRREMEEEPNRPRCSGLLVSFDPGPSCRKRSIFERTLMSRRGNTRYVCGPSSSRVQPSPSSDSSTATSQRREEPLASSPSLSVGRSRTLRMERTRCCFAGILNLDFKRFYPHSDRRRDSLRRCFRGFFLGLLHHPLKRRQNTADVVDVKPPLVDGHRRPGESEELPVLPRRHAAVDGGQGLSRPFVIHLDRPHLGDALPKSRFDVVLLRFHYGPDRGAQPRDRVGKRQEEIALPQQAATGIDVQALAREDGDALAG